MPTSKTLRPRAGFSRVPHPDFVTRCRAVLMGMKGNPRFPKPPVSLSEFEADIDRYQSEISDALDGSRSARARRDSLKGHLMTHMRQLAAYVEAESRNDLAVFATSGFDAIPLGPSAPQEAPQPDITRIRHGVSGELLVSITPFYRQALCYELRYTVQDENGAPVGSWTNMTLTSARAAVRVDGLTPATTYVFQVRALGKRGYSEWSGPASKMCI